MSKIFFLYLYILIIFLLSLTPPSIANSIQFYGIDKILHFFEYLFLGMIFISSTTHSLSKYYFLIFIIPITDEFIVQDYSGRNVDIFDFIANILGLIFGILLFKYFLKYKIT